MTNQEYKVHIIGGGVSGLVAAIQLEKEGFAPTIIEATDRVGGRVKTDIVGGYQLDHGFQVLLDGYPKAQEYLDYKALDLQYFQPGAVIFKNGKPHKIGDPLRDMGLLWSTLISNVGSLSDKLAIFKLNKRLSKTSIKAIFEQPEVSTKAYLKSLQFSDRIVDNFFTPFFTGIFLEPELATSNRMFEFVYKMFGEGNATLPKAGIEAIPRQLKSQLKTTKFIFDTRVKEVSSDTIVLENGTQLESHAAIVATDAATVIPNLRNQDVNWKSCTNLYFETERNTLKQPLIGLVADKQALVNNIFFHDSLETTSSGTKSLLSVTVVKDHSFSKSNLIEQVQQELTDLCGVGHTRFLKSYDISQALPDINNIRYTCHASEMQLKERVFLAGDHLLNGSLNAAMLSGELAARGLVQALQGGITADDLVSDSMR